MLASVLILLLAGCIGYGRRRRYRSCFRIPSERDDVYRLRGAPVAHRISARALLEWPAAQIKQDSSVFLAVDVAATALGAFFDPYVEVKTDDAHYRQYFERGARGTRYLNLSPLFQQSRGPTPAARLQGCHLTWSSDATLLVFDPLAAPSGDTLIVAPHPDDSEIAAFGLYSGRSSWVATLTAGEGGTIALPGVAPGSPGHTNLLARLRTWDSLTVPQMGDVAAERCLNLVYPDTRLRQMHAQPERRFRLATGAEEIRGALRRKNQRSEFNGGSTEVCWRDLIADLHRLLDIIRPACIVCPHPLIDPHYDHVFTAVALAEALQGGAPPPHSFLLYVVHANEAPLFPFGPAESVVSLPPWNDPEWVAESIHSHPLTEATRRAKFFAVEASHDLRASTDAQWQSAAEVIRGVRRQVVAWLSAMPTHPTDFRRRSPRPNEIFFEVSPGGFLELAHRVKPARVPPE